MVCRPVKELVSALLGAKGSEKEDILSATPMRIASLVEDIITAVQHIEEVNVAS